MPIWASPAAPSPTPETFPVIIGSSTRYAIARRPLTWEVLCSVIRFHLLSWFSSLPSPAPRNPLTPRRLRNPIPPSPRLLRLPLPHPKRLPQKPRPLTRTLPKTKRNPRKSGPTTKCPPSRAISPSSAAPRRQARLLLPLPLNLPSTGPMPLPARSNSPPTATNSANSATSSKPPTKNSPISATSKAIAHPPPAAST